MFGGFRMLCSAHCGGMFAPTPDEAPAADELWAAFGALRMLQDAEAQLYDLSAETSRLVDDVAWRNTATSVVSLQKLLGALAQQIGREVVSIREQQGHLRAGMQL